MVFGSPLFYFNGLLSSTNRYHYQRTDPLLSPAPVADFSPADFADNELDLPYYFSHFHRIANAVEVDGPDRGFINISVWRNPKDNKPHNARIMENILALAFFFCTDRPWNVFFAQPDLRQRLETALDFWCGIQNGDGRFSEYGSGNWNLAATAFATKFMGQTLHLLDSGPPIDSVLHQRVIAADRKALYATFTLDELQTHGRNFTNQYANAWGGALAYLDLFPDSELEHLLDQRLEESLTEFQSPAGYFYERSGPDWGYFLGTHHSDIHVAYHYARGTDRASIFLEKERPGTIGFPTMPWREPDGTGYALNRAIGNPPARELSSPISRQSRRCRERSNSGDIDTTALGEVLELPRLWSHGLKHMHEISQMRAHALKPIGPLLRRSRWVSFGRLRLMRFCTGITLHGIPVQKKKKRPLRCCPISHETTLHTSGLTVVIRWFLRLSVVHPITPLLTPGLCSVPNSGMDWD